jgi:uncharacterized protein YjbI with pentapeptide repeats
MEKLKVFISSKMAELRDVRELVAKALDDKGIEAWVYEAHAGARPEDVVETSLSEVEAADIYVGLFWEKYGEVTVQEYRHARALDKPCFVYIRDKDIQREQALEDFLRAEVYDLHVGVTYDYFDSAVQLGEQVADDIMAWLVRRHREMTAEIQAARVSQDEIARLQAEVDRLQAASRERLPQGTPADYLAQQMRAWFETLGYRFESHDIHAEDYFEWIINVPARRRYDRILVRGIEGEAEVSDVAALRQAVDEQRTDEGWLVTARRKSQAACDAIEKDSRLFCYTFDELLDEHADFSHYLDWLKAEVKRLGIDKMYVPLACTKEEFDPVTKEKAGESRYDESNGWIEGYIDRWLDDPSKEHISILGEFGTGKTWFALHYAWTAAQRYCEAKERGIERPRLPLFIPLRDYAKAVSVESLFSEFFFRKHEIPLPGYSAFEQLNRMGKLLLIFDGFDEMAARVDRQKMINNFWELARVVVPGSKAILTCRIEHFPEAREGRALLGAELQASTAKLTGEPPQFEVLELEKFDDDQIRQVLSFRASPDTVERVMGNPELLDLARRPIMTEYILEALPDIEAGKPVDLARVYLYAVQRKMERDIKAERTFTSMADKLYFLCELSWEMLSTDQMSLNYRHFPDRIRRFFGTVVQEQKDLDHWHYDMMGQTMLIRNADGDYSPAHRSLLEFFAAYKFAAEMGALQDDFVEAAGQQRAIDEDKAPQDYKWSDYFQRERDRENEIIPIPPLRGFITEPMEYLVTTTGLQPLGEAILTLMADMVNSEKLWAIVQSTRSHTQEEVGYVGGNVASVLARMGKLAGGDLSKTILTGANLDQGDLRATVFRRAYLQGARMVQATAAEADFTEADLTDTVLSIADLTKARMIRANLSRARMRSTSLEGADLRGAIVNEAELKNVHLQGAILDDIDFSKALLLGRTLRYIPAKVLAEIINQSNGDRQLQLISEVGKARLRDSSIINLLIRMMEDPNPLIRAGIIQALGKLWVMGSRDFRQREGPRIIELFMGTMHDSDPSIRAATVWALGRIDDIKYLDYIQILAEDKAPQVRVSVAKILGRRRDLGRLRLLRQLLFDEDETVRRTAVYALGRMQETEAIIDIERLVEREHNKQVLVAAKRVLRELKQRHDEENQ